MLFVPMTPPPPPSPRVRELSDRLKAELDRYRRDHPAVSDREVRMAVRHVASRVGSRATARTLMAVVGGVAALVGVGTALVLSGSREASAVWETLGPYGVFGVAIAVLTVVILLVSAAR